jgi:hypothetical protein
LPECHRPATFFQGLRGLQSHPSSRI